MVFFYLIQQGRNNRITIVMIFLYTIYSFVHMHIQHLMRMRKASMHALIAGYPRDTSLTFLLSTPHTCHPPSENIHATQDPLEE